MAAPAAGAAPGAEGMHVTVLSPEQTVYEGPATHVLAPAVTGYLGILKDHAPLMALLGEGTLRVDNGRESRSFKVSGGFLQVAKNEVTVLSEHAEPA